MIVVVPAQAGTQHRLLWFEQHATMASAIAREKSIKEWKRAWKIELIESYEPR